MIIAYVISWAMWSPLVVVGLENPAASLLIVMGGFGPLLSAVIVTWITEGGVGLRELGNRLKWRVGVGWYLVALLLPLVHIFLAYGLYLLMRGTPIDFSMGPPWHLYPLGILFVFFLGGGNEELGWRGFALPRLLNNHSPLVASLILGFVWAFWHFPLFFVEASPQAALPFELYLPHVLGTTIIFTWLYLETSGSVLIAMLYHAGLNTVAGYFPLEAGVIHPLAYIVVVEWVIAIILIVVHGYARFVSKRNVVSRA
ncbi:hypothetical protein AC482_05700 [miscellaneous Crenarchaeota group-15 archaeon DG-45]|uniref:CAAX prenyl protease 2/Lysostaphin resistance protein A-like domain-containing protein n=1 Tax=miscellaneous Crenarchaeota group-15 archaeon DG-45 TaxID=1685127 RepID=A0A0M0BMF8_9ARCH|nr:MAG: hypothetical protein AC482_05700 [miscellaneous Crenarchaeota group-15 archaeon DG-45]